MGLPEIEDTIVVNQMAVVAQVMHMQGGVSVEAVHLVVGRTGDETNFDAVHILYGKGLRTCWQAGTQHRREHAKAAEKTFFHFHDAKLRSFFHI